MTEATAPPPAARSVIGSYYALAGLYTLSASVIWGVNTLFLLDAGLSFFEVFVANAAYSVGTVLFEIPTGVVADTLGRRASFLFSVVVLAASTLLYVALAETGAGVVAFSVVSVFMGLGFTFYSGAVEAWLVDALAETGYEGGLDRVFARGQQVVGGAMLVGTVGGGLLGQWSLSVPFVVRSVLLAALFVLAYGRMRDIGFSPRAMTAAELPAEMAANARAGVSFGWRQRPLRLLMVASMVQMGFFGWAFYAWQPYLLDLLDRDAVWVAGLVSAGISLSAIAGNQVVEWASERCGRRTTLMLWAAGLQTSAAVVVGLATSFWVALPALLLMTSALGLNGPVRQAYVHALVPSAQRATVVSFDSMISGAGGVGGQVGLGALGQSRSVSAGYVVGGALTAIALPVLWAVRRLGGEADRIVGAAAGVEGSCAAPGLPSIATVQGQHAQTV